LIAWRALSRADGWLMAGLVAGIMKNRPESLSHFAVHDIYNVLQVAHLALPLCI
jgi:hypothetical protein